MILRDVQVEGRRTDVSIADGVIEAIGTSLPAGGGEEIDGRGGALLPGLHDHHLHLMALAASRTSVDCSKGLDGLPSAPGAWIRGVGFPGSVDRHVLDALVPDRPVRVQHRSGALWMLNTVALRRVELDQSGDVERDQDGEPTGRLWRYDARLRRQLPDAPPPLLAVVDDLLALGITSVTDATPDLGPEAVRLLTGLPLDVTLLGDPNGSAPQKILLHDHDLPSWDELVGRVRTARRADRAVAVHCVTRHSLVLTLAVLAEVGRQPGDRVEHAAVVPDPSALVGLRVVTQPGFLADRGDDYARDVDPEDLPHLYRHRSLLTAGVDVVASSDAPYGPLDPWAVIRAARDRRTPAGAVLGPDDRVSAAVALAGYLTGPGGERRRIVPGAVADLTLLHVPLADALADPRAEMVHLALTRGSVSTGSR